MFTENEKKYNEITDTVLGPLKRLHMQAEEDIPVIYTVKAQQHNIAKHGASARFTQAPRKINAVLPTMTCSDLIEFRCTVYLTIKSSLLGEEAAHKLNQMMEKYPGRERELCSMIAEVCLELPNFQKYHGLIGKELCSIFQDFTYGFEDLLGTFYGIIDQYHTCKFAILRVSLLFC